LSETKGVKISFEEAELARTKMSVVGRRELKPLEESQ